MTVITNTESYDTVTMSQVQAWCTANSISTTGVSISLTPGLMGRVKEFDIDTTLTPQQISDFKSKFINMRIQGSYELVPSADTLTLTNANFLHITGNTPIKFITTTGWKLGSMITLHFGQSNTIHSNTVTAPPNTKHIFLKANSDTTFTVNSTLTLLLDGGAWVEIARMEF